ncbi:hypothetical protein FB451DRAFT_1429686 [Mycena latifolia]|nr:hypothetical protein FB451DRAFT_1429686 [Mycena latifolia]
MTEYESTLAADVSDASTTFHSPDTEVTLSSLTMADLKFYTEAVTASLDSLRLPNLHHFGFEIKSWKGHCQPAILDFLAHSQPCLLTQQAGLRSLQLDDCTGAYWTCLNADALCPRLWRFIFSGPSCSDPDAMDRLVRFIDERLPGHGGLSEVGVVKLTVALPWCYDYDWMLLIRNKVPAWREAGVQVSVGGEARILAWSAARKSSSSSIGDSFDFDGEASEDSEGGDSEDDFYDCEDGGEK